MVQQQNGSGNGVSAAPSVTRCEEHGLRIQAVELKLDETRTVVGELKDSVGRLHESVNEVAQGVESIKDKLAGVSLKVKLLWGSGAFILSIIAQQLIGRLF